jgi:hypothetical protein
MIMKKLCSGNFLLYLKDILAKILSALDVKKQDIMTMLV